MEEKVTEVIIVSNAKCKHCKNLLRTYPGKRVVFRCAVDNAHITSTTKACDKFEL